MLEAGARLDRRFVLEEELGRGASGVVFRARDMRLDEDVALKVLHPWLAETPEVRGRFKREIVLARRVSHPGVCRIFDLHEDGETLFFTMELIHGKTLARSIHDDGVLTPPKALAIMEAVTPALRAAHAAGVVHRDLKPGNIVVRTDGSVVLLDFGMATSSDVARLTVPGKTVGSLRFIAPELWSGERATIRSDLYSLGVVLYACLTGRLPYESQTPAALVKEMQARNVPAISTLNPAVTPAIEAVVKQAMAYAPNDRFANVDEMLAAFRTAVTGGGPSILRGPSRIAIASGVAFALILVVAVVAAAVAETPRVKSGGRERPAPVAPPSRSVADEDPEEQIADIPIEITPPDARELVSSATRRRGLLSGDDPELDDILVQAREVERSNEGRARQLYMKALRRVRMIPVDRGFIVAKQKRLQIFLEESDGATRDRVRPHESETSDRFAQQDYAGANESLNRAFAALKP